jgi:hypothetical protein
MKYLISLTLWLTLDDEDFPWDLVLIHSNGDRNTFILTQVVTKTLIILSKAHSWDSNNVLKKGICFYLECVYILSNSQ